MSASTRRLLAAGSLLALMASTGLACLLWNVSGRIYSGAIEVPTRPADPRVEGVVAAADDSIITLRAVQGHRSRIERPGIWGLRWPGGYGRIGAVLEFTDSGTRRAFHSAFDPPAVGTSVWVDPFLYSGAPDTSLGLHCEEVRIATELGAFPAWLVPGRAQTWAILVHGKAAGREEGLRMIEILAARGYPCLAITYRNDWQAARSPDGRYSYGGGEWRDVEAAVRYTRARLASGVILVGYSMGGAIVMTFLERSAERTAVRGAILESPMLRLETTVDHGFKQLRVPLLETPYPRWMVGASKRLASLRFRFQWSGFDRLATSDSLQTPLLLLHGGRDEVVPVETSILLQRRRPERVTLVRFPEAGHVECWNVDRARYRHSVLEFLESLRGPG